MVIFEKVRTAQDRLSEKFQALYASAMYKNEPLTFYHSIIDRAANLSHGLYGDFQMPENTERSDYQCETPKNWITGRLFSKMVGGNVR